MLASLLSISSAAGTIDRAMLPGAPDVCLSRALEDWQLRTAGSLCRCWFPVLLLLLPCRPVVGAAGGCVGAAARPTLFIPHRCAPCFLRPNASAMRGGPFPWRVTARIVPRRVRKIRRGREGTYARRRARISTERGYVAGAVAPCVWENPRWDGAEETRGCRPPYGWSRGLWLRLLLLV
jgi:hypothetical protein